jgi:hypothetical protein
MSEFPLYLSSDLYAVLGGWHFPWPEGDWYDHLEDRFIGMTLRDSEPWVEVWLSRSGRFEVCERIT